MNRFLRYITGHRLSFLDMCVIVIACAAPFWWGIGLIVVGAFASVYLESRVPGGDE